MSVFKAAVELEIVLPSLKDDDKLVVLTFLLAGDVVCMVSLVVEVNWFSSIVEVFSPVSTEELLLISLSPTEMRIFSVPLMMNVMMHRMAEQKTMIAHSMRARDLVRPGSNGLQTFL